MFIVSATSREFVVVMVRGCIVKCVFIVCPVSSTFKYAPSDISQGGQFVFLFVMFGLQGRNLACLIIALRVPKAKRCRGHIPPS